MCKILLNKILFSMTIGNDIILKKLKKKRPETYGQMIFNSSIINHDVGMSKLL